MICCLSAPSHYLNLSWLIITKVPRHDGAALDWQIGMIISPIIDAHFNCFYYESCFHITTVSQYNKNKAWLSGRGTNILETLVSLSCSAILLRHCQAMIRCYDQVCVFFIWLITGQNKFHCFIRRSETILRNLMTGFRLVVIKINQQNTIPKQILFEIFIFIWRVHHKRPGRIMMTSSNGNLFRVTGPLCGHRWIPIEKTSDTELWCFLWSAPE